jgi:hypothetical protein
MANRTMAWLWVEGFLIEAFGASAIDDNEWGQLVAEIAQRHASVRGVLAVTGGAAPNATQRAELTAALQGAAFPAAIVSDSAAARVALTAINLFLANQARPFPPNQLDAAFTYLKVPEALWPQLRLEIPRLQAVIGKA